ncbi:MAG TPA: AMP-binding protein, partial [Actinomycetota bacterium]|nr:AMP-binding protein [Actinomycetota bacterium]
FHLRQEGEVWLPVERLHESARRRASELVSRGVEPGDAVGVLGPNSPEWITWAFAAWFAGAAMVPLPYPLRVRDREAFREQIASLMNAAGCKVGVGPERFAEDMPDGKGIDWTFDPGRMVASLPEDRPRPEDTAVIQFTSGSTAFPKGAVLPHRSTVAATRNFHLGFGEYDPENSRQVSWLPFFHDWGLFGQVIRPVVAGNQIDIMQTEQFARTPGKWLRLATERRARYLEAPPTAWAGAIRSALHNPEGIDLSNVQGVALGAEPVSAEVIELLEEAGKVLGLARDTLHVAYGMAEVCLGLTINRWEQPLRVDPIDLEEMVANRRAVPASDERLAKRVVSCGSPGPETEIRIATPGTSEALPERHIGEILAKAASVMDGYLGLPDDQQPFIDGWLRTGDTGYVADGELYVTGRIKDIVIVLGRNYAPEDLEWAAERVKGVRTGRTVAFARPNGSEGEVVVVVEPEGATDPASLPVKVRQSVSDSVGLSPREVLVLAKGSVPKTTSGKIRRNALRDLYEKGELEVLATATEQTASLG